MFQSLQIGRAFGIPLYIHWTFWLLPLYVVMLTADSGPVELALHLGLLAAAFACVVLHELGHALAARVFGIGTRDISLYPIGGVARLERMSERPAQELWIAVAGPAVNLAIAALLTAVLLVSSALDPSFVFGSLAGLFLFRLLLINVIMVAFNLLPAFPMDGGRVLRALLSLKLGHLRATRIAVHVGVVAALLLGAGGTWFFGNPWLMVIAFFVFVAGQAELQAVYFRERQRRLDLLDGGFSGWRPEPQAPQPAFPMPRVTVYTWDDAAGRWVRDGGPNPGPAR